MASGVGARLSTGPRDIPGHAFWFGEDQGRYLLAVADSPRSFGPRRVPACRWRGLDTRVGGI